MSPGEAQNDSHLDQQKETHTHCNYHTEVKGENCSYLPCKEIKYLYHNLGSQHYR